MQLDVTVRGSDASSDTLSSLQEWIRDEQIPDVTVNRKQQPPETGQMGVDPVTLSVVLGAPVLVELVRSIHTWIKTRRRNITLVIKNNDSELTLNAENIDDVDAAVKRALSTFGALK